jgi:FkbM family methyltransferase
MAIPRTRDLALALRGRIGALKRSLRSDLRYVSESFAQEGEDLILKRIFEEKRGGFYVDVGAHHPMRFSNTYLFYKAGWRGINIDATPGSMVPFRTERPRDINLETGISERTEKLRYYIFDEPALNTFSAELASDRETKTSYKVVNTVEISASPLADVLARNLPTGQVIDFLTVDVEGWDLQVLRSNDWDRFAPHVVVAEVLGHSLDDLAGSEIAAFLRSKGYGLFAKTFNSVFFRRG